MFLQRHLKNDEYFTIDYLKSYLKEYKVRFIAITGARGCGKTYSFLEYVRDFFENDKKALYIRNSRKGIASARQYFSVLEHGDWVVTLGSLGASTIVLENKDSGDKILIGYTLWICDYEEFKSSKKKINYVIYEEFSTFSGGTGMNRILALTELFETISQTDPNFYFFAIANNLFYDDLLENLLDSEMFLHIQLTKDVVKNGVKNSAIKAYLQGEYLLPELSINLKNHECLGYIDVANTKVYIFESEFHLPKYVISSTGSGGKLHIDTSITDMIRMANYKNMKERNKCEFVVGILLQASHLLRT